VVVVLEGLLEVFIACCNDPVGTGTLACIGITCTDNAGVVGNTCLVDDNTGNVGIVGGTCLIRTCGEACAIGASLVGGDWVDGACIGNGGTCIVENGRTLADDSGTCIVLLINNCLVLFRTICAK
jgi:hypothetical protein